MKETQAIFSRLYQTAMRAHLAGRARPDPEAMRKIGSQIRDSTVKTEAGQTPRTRGKKRLVLLGLRERVEMIGGTFEIESAPGLGTKIIARIPISKATERRWQDEPVEISH